jgi:RNA polymerase sigma-70 factor (ECF subfamily)
VDGTRAVFDDAFRVEYPAVVRVVAPIVGSVEDAEALTQDAFVKAYLRWPRVGRYDRPGAWVRRVAIRDAVRFAERRRRPLPQPDGTRDALDDVAGRLDLLGAVRALPPRQRACVVLFHLADWPSSDVAEALGCSEATVRVHLHRARAALAALLGADEPEVSDGR